MHPKQFAEFFARQGYRILKTESSSWYEIHPFCWQSIPYHKAIEPTAEEIKSIFFKNTGLLIRFFSQDYHNALTGSIWICDRGNYDFVSLETKSRNQTRRGLEKNHIKPVSFDLLVKEGWRLIKDTAQRQGRNPDFANPNEWVRYCNAAGSIPDFDAWGAFLQERLISFLVGAEIDNYYYILQQASETSYLSNYPNNALIYTVTKVKLAEPSLSMVSYGLDSVEDTSGLRKFKQGMGFYPKDLNQRILINPLFRWLKDRKINSALKYLLKISPKNNYLRKADAILKQISS